jgi:hypothetical protein
VSWWRGQNLEGPLHGVDGRSWHFLVWHGSLDNLYSQRIFFWDETKLETGFIELKDGDTLHVTKIRDRQRKIVRDPAYRARWLQPLEFPIERHWPAP